MVASMKMAVGWVCSTVRLVEVYGLTDLMMRAISTTETSVNFYKATWHYNPEDKSSSDK
jgi:hypothetical protein